MDSPTPSCDVRLLWKFDMLEKGTFSPTDEERSFICGLSESVKSVVDDIKFRIFLRKDDDCAGLFTFLEISKPDFPGAVVFHVTGEMHRPNFVFYRVTSDDPFIWEFSSDVGKAFIGDVDEDHFSNVQLTLKVAVFVREITGNSIVDRLMTDESLSDVTVKVGGMEIHAQKCVLAMHSKYFKRAFKRQKGTDLFVIEDFSYQSIKAMVNFLYARVDHEELRKNMEEVLAVADKYEVQSLKDYVSGLLENNIAQSPVRVAELAYRCNAPRLLQVCVEYVEANFKEVSKSDDWRTLVERNPNVLYILTQQDPKAVQKVMAQSMATTDEDEWA